MNIINKNILVKNAVEKVFEHKNYKSTCKECSPQNYCEHNKIKSTCKDCGGSSICEHNNYKSTCKECGGASICEHNKIRSSCKECGGGSICEHNKIKSACKECNGSAFCIHNKRKVYCKECVGSQICEHDKIKTRCKECDGSEICEHDKIKSKCKECDGSSFCIHNKRKERCKECYGTAICIYNKRKESCRDCNGSIFCEHNKVKYICKDCGGSAFCNHDKRKDLCIICNPKIACENCKLNVKSSNKTYHPYCFNCYCVLNPEIEIVRRYKTKENLLAEALKYMNLDIEFIQDKKIEGGCSLRRPDFLFECLTHTVITECNENNHTGYDTICEIAKLNEQFTDLADRPMIIINFNPDYSKETKTSCFDSEGKLIKEELNKRIKVLEKELKRAIKGKNSCADDELITIINLF